MSRAVLVCLAAAFALSTSSASAGPRPASSAADTVVIADIADVVGGFNWALTCCQTINPALVMGLAGAIHGAYFEDSRGEWVEDLVTHVSVSRTGVTYTISPKAYWYWGGRKLPVTYRDFVYTLQQLLDPKNDVADRAGYANLDPTRFTHKGDRQVTFFWRTSGCSTDTPCGPYADWQSLFGTVYPADALAGLGFNTIWTDCICGKDGKPVANGPFYLARYTKGEGYTLLRNPYWGGTKPGIARIVFKVIPNEELLVEAMRSGAVDALFQRGFDQNLLTLKGVPGLTLEVGHAAFEHLAFREGRGSSNTLLRAPWMRQAISLAIDRQAIIRTLLPGLGLEPLDSLLFFPNEADYRRDFARWSYNPAKALALLKARCTGGPSKPDPGNKKVWQCSGLPATFRWTWRADIPSRTQLEALAKADLQSVGITLIEWPMAPQVIFGPDGLASGDFDIADFANASPDEYRCSSYQDFAGYCSHTVDALLNAADAELRPAKRAALFRRVDAILAADVPAMPLYQQPTVLIHKSALRGMHANQGPFHNVEDWHWKR